MAKGDALPISPVNRLLLDSTGPPGALRTFGALKVAPISSMVPPLIPSTTLGRPLQASGRKHLMGPHHKTTGICHNI